MNNQKEELSQYLIGDLSDIIGSYAIPTPTDIIEDLKRDIKEKYPSLVCIGDYCGNDQHIMLIQRKNVYLLFSIMYDEDGYSVAMECNRGVFSSYGRIEDTHSYVDFIEKVKGKLKDMSEYEQSTTMLSFDINDINMKFSAYFDACGLTYEPTLRCMF